MPLNFDILIASYFRASILEKCLVALVNSSHPSLGNIIVLTHSQDAKTLQLLETYTKKIPLVIRKVDKCLSPGASRNLLIERSTADFVHFLDDDAFVPQRYYEQVWDYLKKNVDIDVLGGVDIPAPDTGWRQSMLGEILASDFVMGVTAKRHKKSDSSENMNASELELTLCNLWIRAKILKDDQYTFSEKILRCEENLLLQQIKKDGYKIVAQPKLFVFHQRREDLVDIAKIQFRSGFYRGVTLFSFYEKTFTIPLITGIYIFSLLFGNDSPLTILLIGLHLFLFGKSIGFNLWKKYKPIQLLYGYLVVVAIHVFFSMGLVVGVIKEGSRRCLRPWN
jgi:glycosyltransferase involved in cell wall biosynthesis